MDVIYRETLPDREAYQRLFETTGWNVSWAIPEFKTSHFARPRSDDPAGAGGRIIFLETPYQADARALERAISGSWYAVSAYHGDQLLGFGRLISDGVLYAFICDMIVHPSYQGRGIGSAILERLLAKCRDAGVRVVWLFAAQGKAGFYERYGFVPRLADAPGMQWIAIEA